jgi:SAM-dependent methyltransferase
VRLIDSAVTYYEARFAEHGPEPRGVDWKDEDSQRLRFDRLLELVPAGEPFSITDFGCGYGALVEHLEERRADFTYQGFDRAASLVAAARELHAGAGRTFASIFDELAATDYGVASGVFNVKQEAEPAAWSAYVVDSIRELWSLCRAGMSFNLLTSYSDPDKMRPDLYYADPSFYFDLCKRELSPHVALLHDYPLWEFTVLVRRAPRS